MALPPCCRIIEPAWDASVWLVATMPNFVMTARLIEGQFPNYRQVIPTSHSTRVLAQREELLKATRLASYFARDAANMLRFQVDPSNDPPLVITANAAEVDQPEPATPAFAATSVKVPSPLLR